MGVIDTIHDWLFSPPEKAMAWLTREEEMFGVTGAIERTIDFEKCRSLLAEELAYEPTEEQVKWMYEGARYKYEALPEISISTSQVIYPWGAQTWFRDIPTGRRMSAGAVEKRLVDIGWY